MQVSALLTIWFLAYVLPLAIACGISTFLPSKSKALYGTFIVHIALLVSIAASQYIIHSLALSFPWHVSMFSLLALVIGVGLAVVFIGSLGFWYATSAFIQELMMLSMVFLLLPTFPIYMVILLIVPIFVACHFLTFDDLKAKLTLIPLWGIASILLFVVTHNIYFIATLHTVFGAFLFSRSVLGSGLKSMNSILET